LFYLINANKIWPIIYRNDSTIPPRASLRIEFSRTPHDRRSLSICHKSTQCPQLLSLRSCSKQHQLKALLHSIRSLLRSQNHHLVVWAQQGINCPYTRRNEFQPGSMGTCLIFKTNFGGMKNRTYACISVDIASLSGQGIFHTGSPTVPWAFWDVFFE